jgi:Fur family ferric uptake transcriptional regulator
LKDSSKLHPARRYDPGMDVQPSPAETPVGAPGDEELAIVEPLCAVFRRKLKAEGLKYTPERAQILDAILRFDGLFEAEQLLETLKRRDYRVSKATVYRTIRLLQDAGIIQRVLFDQDQSHYQLVYGRRPNDLLIRLDTREVIPIEVPQLIDLRARICRERGLTPQGHRFHVFAAGDGK